MTKKSDPTKDPVFQKTLKSLLGMKPKTQSEMKLGKKKAASKRPSKKVQSQNARL